MAWLCKPCDAYVGCHNNTKKPLGTMANRETREWRKKAHAVYDTLWDSGFKDKYWELDGKDRRAMKYMRRKRKELYERISKDFGYEVHIGSSNIEQCKKIIAWCNQKECLSKY